MTSRESRSKTESAVEIHVKTQVGTHTSALIPVREGTRERRARMREPVGGRPRTVVLPGSLPSKYVCTYIPHRSKEATGGQDQTIGAQHLHGHLQEHPCLRLPRRWLQDRDHHRLLASPPPPSHSAYPPKRRIFPPCDTKHRSSVGRLLAGRGPSDIHISAIPLSQANGIVLAPGERHLPLSLNVSAVLFELIAFSSRHHHRRLSSSSSSLFFARCRGSNSIQLARSTSPQIVVKAGTLPFLFIFPSPALVSIFSFF